MSLGKSLTDINRLSHMIALTKGDKTRVALERIVTTILGVKAGISLTTAQEVQEAVTDFYNLTFTVNQIQSVLDRLTTAGDIQSRKPGEAIQLSTLMRTAVESRINETKQLEADVRSEWIATCKVGEQSLSPTVATELWTCLKNYISSTFLHHGAETIQLLDPSTPSAESDRNTLTSYLNDAIRTSCTSLSPIDAEQLIRTFFSTLTEIRIKWLTSLLDGTFTFYALTIDAATAEYLASGLPKLSIFADTNIIFGVLKIHSNQFVNDVAVEIIETIRKYKLPFTLYVHSKTLEEYQNYIDRAAERLRSCHWTSGASRAALQSRQFAEIDNQYHEHNSTSPCDADVFLLPFVHIQETLKSFGFIEYPVQNIGPQDQKRHQLTADYIAFQGEHPPNRVKSYAVSDHDIQLWQTVQGLRKPGSRGLNVGAFFLTADVYFRNYDWDVLTKSAKVGASILPNQFLQLLRPFISADKEFDRRFVESLALPEFRASSEDHTRTALLTLQIINRFANQHPETGAKILRDELLTKRLMQVEYDHDKYATIIGEYIGDENVELRKENEALTAELRETKLSEQKAKGAAVETGRAVTAEHIQHEMTKTELQTAISTLTEQGKRIQSLEDEKAATEERRKQQKAIALRILRYTFALAISAVLLYASIKVILVRPWFASHPKKVGIGLLLSALSVCIGALIAELKKGWVLWLSLIGAAIYALSNIIDK